MATQVSICSSALLMLGGKPISALDDTNIDGVTDGVTLASNLYGPIRLWILRAHPWHSCKKRVVLAPDATTPAFDWSYQFSLPADWLRTLQVGEKDDAVDYQMEGTKILCDDAVFRLRYLFDNDNPATYDSMLAQGLTLALQAAFAYPITKSTSVRDQCEKQLQFFLKQARAVSGQDDPPETFGDFRLLAAGLTTGY